MWFSDNCKKVSSRRGGLCEFFPPVLPPWLQGKFRHREITNCRVRQRNHERTLCVHVSFKAFMIIFSLKKWVSTYCSDIWYSRSLDLRREDDKNLVGLRSKCVYQPFSYLGQHHYAWDSTVSAPVFFPCDLRALGISFSGTSLRYLFIPFFLPPPKKSKSTEQMRLGHISLWKKEKKKDTGPPLLPLFKESVYVQ